MLVCINVVASTVIYSCVFSLQTLCCQSHCAAGGVYCDAELVFQWIFVIWASITALHSNPLQSFPCRLSNPSCIITTHRVGDLTGDGQCLTWLDSHRGWLGELFTVHICWKTKVTLKCGIAAPYYPSIKTLLIFNPPDYRDTHRKQLQPTAAQKQRTWLMVLKINWRELVFSTPTEKQRYLMAQTLEQCL